MGAMVSPLTGPAGNVEFLVHARRGAGGDQVDDVGRLLSDTVGEAASRRSAPNGGGSGPNQGGNGPD